MEGTSKTFSLVFFNCTGTHPPSSKAHFGCCLCTGHGSVCVATSAVLGRLQGHLIVTWTCRLSRLWQLQEITDTADVGSSMQFGWSASPQWACCGLAGAGSPDARLSEMDTRRCASSPIRRSCVAAVSKAWRQLMTQMLELYSNAQIAAVAISVPTWTSAVAVVLRRLSEYSGTPISAYNCVTSQSDASRQCCLMESRCSHKYSRADGRMRQTEKEILEAHVLLEHLRSQKNKIDKKRRGLSTSARELVLL